VLEQLYAPLIVAGGDAHDELKAIARRLYHPQPRTSLPRFRRHPVGVYEKQHQLQPLLYVFRVLKTGIHLMRTGRIEANLNQLLDDDPRIPYLGDLIAKKQADGERSPAPQDHGSDYLADIELLRTELRDARDRSIQPDSTTARPALKDFVVLARLATSSQIG
jgi:uncharacterized protein